MTSTQSESWWYSHVHRWHKVYEIWEEIVVGIIRLSMQEKKSEKLGEKKKWVATNSLRMSLPRQRNIKKTWSQQRYCNPGFPFLFTSGAPSKKLHTWLYRLIMISGRRAGVLIAVSQWAGITLSLCLLRLSQCPNYTLWILYSCLEHL